MVHSATVLQCFAIMAHNSHPHDTVAYEITVHMDKITVHTDEITVHEDNPPPR